MNFHDIMAMTVGRAIVEDKELSGPWLSFQNTGIIRLLQEACGYGQQIPDSKLGAYYYSLVYQKQHYDVLVEALSENRLPVVGRCLMVDFGAGPGTAALAWAYHVNRQTGEPPALTYIHLDRLQEMSSLSELLFHVDDNLDDKFNWKHYISIPIDAARPQDWGRDADYAVFVFSYIMCQPNVSKPDISRFTQLIDNTCTAINGRSAYLLRIDAPHLDQSWNLLLSKLEALGKTPTPISSWQGKRYTAVYLNPDGTERARRNRAGPVKYNLIQIQ